mmetsp:Transcript_51566/g.120255  ORF Transcript_51566/g.120255 Transcript_51566/m.120255 type:complete len:242 (-) Transcript_51566:7-732(-)
MLWPEASSVNLAHRATSHRLLLELVEQLFNVLAQLILQHPSRNNSRMGRRVSSKLAEDQDHVRGKHVWSHRKPLTKLLKGSACLLCTFKHLVQPELTPSLALFAKQHQQSGSTHKWGKHPCQEHRALQREPSFLIPRPDLVRMHKVPTRLRHCGQLNLLFMLKPFREESVPAEGCSCANCPQSWAGPKLPVRGRSLGRPGKAPPFHRIFPACRLTTQPSKGLTVQVCPSSTADESKHGAVQ